MLKLFTNSFVGINSVVKINCQTKSSINKTIIRTKRQTFSRRPFKVLTDSGKDYYRQNDYKESISSADLEIRPNVMNERERRDYNKNFDEGFSDYHKTIDGNCNDFNVKTKTKPNLRSNKTNKKLNENNDKNENKFNENQMKGKKEKFENVLRPKLAGIPVYQKLSEDNKEFFKLMSSQKTRKGRERDNEMLLEGKRLISDAIKADIKLKAIYFSKEENLVEIHDLNRLTESGLQLKKVFYKDIELFSQLNTSPGVVAVCERPNNHTLITTNYEPKLPLILVADNIRDPGNLGTMVRCAAAVGAMKLLLLKGCADVWESKVLRSGAGGHFRLPIYTDIEWPLLFNYIPNDKPINVLIAESKDDLTVSHGVDESNIPFHTINSTDRDEKTLLRNDSYDDRNRELNTYKNSSIPAISYSDAKCYSSDTERPTVLVIGGETHGLSAQSYKLAYDYMGRKVKIPLAVGVDSLNSSIAAAVIMYEMKRQFDCHQNATEDQIQTINV